MTTLATPKIVTPKIPLRTNVAPTVAAPAPTTGPVEEVAGAVAPSAETTAKAKRVAKKREKVEGEDAYGRVKHPAVLAGGPNYPFASVDAVPKDYNEKKHQPLKKNDFVQDFDFMDFQASQFEARAARLRAKAIKYRSLGAGENRKEQAKLLRMTTAIAALKAKLAAEGVNVEEIEAAALGGDDVE